KISDDDIKEAKTSSTAPIRTTTGTGTSGHDENIHFSGFPDGIPIYTIPPQDSLSIPGTAFFANVQLEASRTSLYSMPDPFAVQGGLVDAMMKGVHIDSTGFAGPPQFNPNSFFDLTISYEDGTNGLIDVADPDYGPFIESGLMPFVYNPFTHTW